MASAAERQVNVTMGSQDGVVRDGNADALAQEIGRLQNELRRTQDINREITEWNKQLAMSKKIPDSVVAPKPFMGKLRNRTQLIGLLDLKNTVNIRRLRMRRKAVFL
jgi:hypothetical protein